MPEIEYILWGRNGGWMTRGAIYHSDPREAWAVDEATARDMCRLHDGRLLPVPKALYLESLKK